ncbi:MAG: hypothetical protein KDC38_12805 [Planctomycetes bacterium]|nr:hypothetical protein [Planctomycetota bacterium]
MHRSIVRAVFFVLLVGSPVVAQPILYVDAAAASGGDGSSWLQPISDLQVALATAAAPGSGVTEIWVRAGTYHPAEPGGSVETSFHMISGVTLFGGFDGTETRVDQRDVATNETILSGDLGDNDTFSPGSGWDGYADNSSNVVRSGGTNSTAVLDGFTVEAGAIVGLIAWGAWGSGLLNDGGSPTIRNCTFRRNYAYRGGAIYNGGPTITVENCTFVDNIAWLGFGAGIFSDTGNLVVRDCHFTNNEAVGGGSSEGGGAGIATWINATMDVARCTFVNNTARNFYASGDSAAAKGAGIFSFGPATIVDCLFDGNDAHAGAGIYNFGNGTVIANCLFQDNSVQAYDVSPAVSQGGGGAGVAVISFTASTTHIVGCTFVGNSGQEGVGAITYGSHLLDIDNSIFWNNTASSPEIVGLQTHVKGNEDVAYCCVEHLWVVPAGEDPLEPGNFPGCFDTNPLFVDPLGGDFHLAAGSPCIDAGDNTVIPAGIGTDLDGLDRRADDLTTPDTGSGGAPVVDLGPYEYGAVSVIVEFVRGDANQDGTIDVADAVTELGALFLGETTSCWSALDANDDGSANVADVVALLAYAFDGASNPPSPFPGCGDDPSDDPLTCSAFAGCP